MPRVNPEILRWARQTAGLGENEAARKLTLAAARGMTPAERIQALEAGDAEPSAAQLVKMAEVYRRPLLTFYLRQPPAPDDRGEDFRTLPDHPEPAAEGLVDALLRDVRARQSTLRDLLVDDEAEPQAFVGSLQREVGVAGAAARLAGDLGFRLPDFRRRPNTGASFDYLRGLVEASGVFVLLIGNLGNYHTALEVESFRGFAIADPIAPLVVVNDQDAKSAWAFTLLHELAHVWLGLSGVSGARAEVAAERFCNEVASEILLPAVELRMIPFDADAGAEQMAGMISAIARPRRLSRTMVALRLHTAGRVTDDRWRELQAIFRQDWLARRERDRRSREEQEGGPNYYTVRRHRLGSALIELIRRHVAEGALTPSKAGQVLGVRSRNVEPLLRPQTA